jgi:hypothetical protein
VTCTDPDRAEVRLIRYASMIVEHSGEPGETGTVTLDELSNTLDIDRAVCTQTLYALARDRVLELVVHPGGRFEPRLGPEAPSMGWLFDNRAPILVGGRSSRGR